MKKISIYGFLISLLAFQACRTVKSNLSEKQFTQEIRSVEQITSDSLQTGRYSISMEIAAEQHQLWAEIIPKGVFSFSPDSGFAGEATRVTVFSHRQAGSLRTDSAASFENRYASAVDRDTSSRVYITSLQQDERRPLPGRWLLWVAVACLMVLFLFLRRAFR